MTTLDRPAAPSGRTRPGLARLLPHLTLLGDASPSPSRPAFAWWVTLANTWILAGLFVDGYFHIHDPDLESFFTPWHALLYSGVGFAVLVTSLEVRRAGRIPDGYLASVAAGPVVGVAGFADMVWHTLLGIEADLAALLSPPHLMLILAGTMLFGGPLRASLRTRDPRLDLPAALSAAAVVTGLAFFTQYANPFTQLLPALQGLGPDGRATGPVTDPALLDLRQVAGVSGVLVFAALVAGTVALLRARTSLPRGALAVAVGLPAFAMTFERSTFFLLPGIALAALLVEVVGRRLTPALLGAVTGAALTTAWVLSLALTRELSWNLELLSGTVCSAAAAGYLVGWLVQQGPTADHTAAAG